MLYGFKYEETSRGYIEIEADSLEEAEDKLYEEKENGNLCYYESYFEHKRELDNGWNV